MKNLLSVVLLTAAVSFGSTRAFADEACCLKAAPQENSGMVKGGAAKEEAAPKGVKIGSPAPNFTLKDANGNDFSLASQKGKVAVVVFFNQNCPYVVEAQPRIAEFAAAYKDKNVTVVAVDAGNNNKAETVKTFAADKPYTVVLNPTSDVAIAYDAKRTPEVFVVDKDGNLAYHGAFDNGQEGADAGARKSFTKDAVDALLAGKQPEVKETKAFGCTIKFAQKADKAEGKKAKAEKAEKHEKHEKSEKHDKH